MSGNPISTVLPGEDFLFHLYVEDITPDPQGVFAAYADVEYGPIGAGDILFEPTGPVIQSSHYPLGFGADVSVLGFMDEMGGFDGINPLGGGEFLLISVPMTTRGTSVRSATHLARDSAENPNLKATSGET
ncbi:MAG: hypothetical protein AAF497_13960 [Planctomycetota bacterium]